MRRRLKTCGYLTNTVMPMRKTKAWQLLLAIAAGATATSVAGAEPEVRELSRKGETVTLGTEAFSVTFEPNGRLRDIRCGERELISFISLYTTPYSFSSGKGLRCVQGEEPSRGMGKRPGTITVEPDGDGQVIKLARLCSHPEIREGKPYLRLTETVDIRPAGVIRFAQEYEWLDLVRWHQFNLIVALNMKELKDRPFRAQYPGFAEEGALTEGKAYTKIEHLDGTIRALSVDTGSGPLVIEFHNHIRASSSRWGQYASVSLRPGAYGYHSDIFRGVRDRAAFTIRLPVRETSSDE